MAAALFFSNFGLQDKVRAVYAEEVSEEAVEEISLQTEASEGSLITGSSEEKEEASKMTEETDSKNSDVENMDIESMDDKDCRLYKQLLGNINMFLSVKDSIRLLSIQEEMVKKDLMQCIQDNWKTRRNLNVGSNSNQ